LKEGEGFESLGAEEELDETQTVDSPAEVADGVGRTRRQNSPGETLRAPSTQPGAIESVTRSTLRPRRACLSAAVPSRPSNARSGCGGATP
jgi:hypothetical protein